MRIKMEKIKKNEFEFLFEFEKFFGFDPFKQKENGPPINLEEINLYEILRKKGVPAKKAKKQIKKYEEEKSERILRDADILLQSKKSKDPEKDLQIAMVKLTIVYKISEIPS